MAETIQSVKLKIQESFKVPARDQVLSPVRHNESMPLLSEDWRTLAGAGLAKGDSLFVLQTSWQRVDAGAKTETKRIRLNLPGPCAEAFEEIGRAHV